MAKLVNELKILQFKNVYLVRKKLTSGLADTCETHAPASLPRLVRADKVNHSDKYSGALNETPFPTTLAADRHKRYTNPLANILKSMKKHTYFILLMIIVISCAKEGSKSQDDYIQQDLQLLSTRSTSALNGLNPPILYDYNSSFIYEYDTLIRFDLTFDEGYQGYQGSYETDGDLITDYLFYYYEVSGSSWSNRYVLTYDTENQLSMLRHRQFHDYMDFNKFYTIEYEVDFIKITDIDTSIETKVFMTEENLLSRCESGSNFVNFDYDSRGNLIAKSDHLGNRVTYTHDTRRNPFQEIAPFNFNEIENITFALDFGIGKGDYKDSRANGTWTNTNNIIEIDATDCSQEDCIRSYTYSFEYNADGYPSKRYWGENGAYFEYDYQ